MAEFDRGATSTPRKIIQIAVAKDELTALCNDGTVWLYDFAGWWVKCEEIPQGDEQDE